MKFWSPYLWLARGTAAALAARDAQTNYPGETDCVDVPVDSAQKAVPEITVGATDADLSSRVARGEQR